MSTDPRLLLDHASRLEGPELAAYRAAGGRVVGYSCVSTPRELLDAAGLLPYRIRALGSAARELADARMSRFNCSFCRSCLQLGLDGSYDFLDGLIETNGCDHLRGMFENWQHAREVGSLPRSAGRARGSDTAREQDTVREGWFFHYLPVPHLINEDTLAVFVEDLGLMRQALEQHYEVRLSDDALRAAMDRQATIRARMRQVQQLRERPEPALSGSEALALTLLESAWPLDRFEELLDDLLHGWSHCRPTRIHPPRARLLLAGSATDELALVQAMEQMGGLIVADGLCYGTRVFWTEETPPIDEDPLTTLARSYLHHLLCPRMFDDYARRLAFITDAVGRAAVEGVVLVHNKFCDLHGVENVRLRIDLEQRGIPVLVLEKEYGAASDLGRIATRLQAFLERLGR